MTSSTRPVVQKQEWLPFLTKWTPRAIAVVVGSYYGLGVSYALGIMARIDRLAIPIIKHFGGYTAVGLMMPTVQWYSAVGMRITMGLGAGLAYDLLEKIAMRIISLCKIENPSSSR